MVEFMGIFYFQLLEKMVISIEQQKLSAIFIKLSKYFGYFKGVWIMLKLSILEEKRVSDYRSMLDKINESITEKIYTQRWKTEEMKVLHEIQFILNNY